MKKTVLLAIGFVIAVVALVIYTTMGNAKFRCEVCMAFQGRQKCSMAAAATEAQAQRTATENACAEISSGVTDSIACESSTPISVIWVTHK